MSRKLDSLDYPMETYELEDIVAFNGPDDTRLIGEIVRVYNSRDDYHVLVDGERYSVNIHSDNVKKVSDQVVLFNEIRNFLSMKHGDLALLNDEQLGSIVRAYFP